MNHDHLAAAYAAFMPHGHCWAWTPGILWMMVVGNALTAVADFSIPIGLFRLVRGRQDLPVPHLFVLFALFILFCGTGHVIDVLTIWRPYYWLDAIWDTFTGFISIATAVVFLPLLPRLLAVGTIEQVVGQETIAALESKNQALAEANARHAEVNQTLQAQMATMDRAAELMAEREARILELRAEVARLKGEGA